MIQTGVAMNKGIIGIDLDRTLAVYHDWQDEIGPPIPAMVERAKRFLDEGKEVVIFTARVAVEEGFSKEQVLHQHKLISAWTKKHLGVSLRATALKSRHLIQIFDDRAVGVVPNTGKIIGPERPADPHPFPNGVPK